MEYSNMWSKTWSLNIPQKIMITEINKLARIGMIFLIPKQHKVL